MPHFDFEHHDTTANCVDHLSDTGRIGRIHAVEGGYLLRDRAEGVRSEPLLVALQAVVVHGAKGSGLYTGLGWGYSGNGANGLRQLLEHLGMDGSKAWEMIVGMEFPEGPDESEFKREGSFIRYWRLDVPAWGLRTER